MSLECQNFSTFKNEFKKLSKKYSSLPEDLDNFKKIVMEPFHLQNAPLGHIIFEIPKLGTGRLKTYKVTRFTCKSLKGNGSKTGIRMTYIFDTIKNEVVFMEIYLKSDKEIEDKNRIKDFIKRYEE